MWLFKNTNFTLFSRQIQADRAGFFIIKPNSYKICLKSDIKLKG